MFLLFFAILVNFKKYSKYYINWTATHTQWNNAKTIKLTFENLFAYFT